MAYVKKTWNPGDHINAADLNNIESGLDDLFNQSITLTGHKKFTGVVRPKTPNVSDIKIQLAAANRLQMYGAAAVWCAVFDEISGSSLPVLFDNDVFLKTINDVYPELHKTRHLYAGADKLLRAPDIIVAQSGEGGDFIDVASAISTMSAGEVLMIREGIYNISGDIAPPARSTIMGANEYTIVQFSTNHGINSTQDGIRIMNLFAKNASITSGYVVSLSGDNCLVDNVRIDTWHAALGLSGTGSIARDCRFNNIKASPAVYSIGLSGADHKVIDCKAYNVHSGISVGANRAIVIGCEFIGMGTSGAMRGIYLRNAGSKSLIEDNIIESFGYSIFNERLSGGNHIVKGNTYFRPIYNPDTSTLVTDNFDMT